MAKSIRSKWRRKMRAIKRERYGQKELERLKKTLGIDSDTEGKNEVDIEEVSKIATVVTAKDIKSQEKPEKSSKDEDNKSDEEENMDTDGKRIFNTKTMRDQHGTYPVWMHQRKIRKAKKARKGRPKRSY